jgi:hypothetical protein
MKLPAASSVQQSFSDWRIQRLEDSMKLAILAVLSLTVAAAAFGADENRLTVHEWGTFTSLQDESGNSIGGINSDDEPVPFFVHRLLWELIIGTPSQGVPRCHPDVTMRLETPVVYIHRPKGDEGKRNLQLSAEFHGGWISEYFPQAKLEVDGKDATQEFRLKPIKPSTTSKISWDITLDGGGVAPETEDHVWVAPRAVAAADVTAGAERERYLFYRGVGHLDAPLRVVRNADRLKIERQEGANGVKIQEAWLADIRDDGSCAFAKLNVDEGGKAEFPASAYSAANLAMLREEMKNALVKDGLYVNEAEAMLKTWELSYFKSAGLRLFFLVPRDWTDHVLPLTVSEPVDLSRVMVGRVELLTKDQREKLAKISSGNLTNKQLENAYAGLGRFRDALVLEQEKRKPGKALKKLIWDRQMIGSAK